MQIRVLLPEDAAEFREVRLRGLLEEPTAFASSHEEEDSTPVEEVARRLLPKAEGIVLGAFDAARLAGVVGVQREGMKKLGHKAFIWGMYVLPEARAQGCGAMLMRHALDHAWHTLHVRQVNLGVHTLNESALRLYRRFGFEIFGTERGALLVDGCPQDEHHMVCRAPS